MKVTVENNVKEYILDKIKDVYIGFNDNVEVRLNQIIDYDIDLNNEHDSTISFTNALNNVEMENHFKGKKSRIIYVRIDAIGWNPDESSFDVFYDIPCDMKIKNLRISGEYDGFGDMHVELEGVVR